MAFSNTDFTHSPANVLRWLMIQLPTPIGTDPSLSEQWPVYFGKEPDKPDLCITTYDTEGHDDGRLMLTGEILMHYGVQIRVRATDEQPNGFPKCSSIRRILAENVYRFTVVVPASAQTGQVTATYLVQAVTHIGPVLHLGWETPNSKRNVFTINAALVLTQVG